MVMQIGSSLASVSAPSTGTRPPEQREAFRQLAQALKAGDLDSAKQAYAGVVRNAPDGATWNPASPFAQLGKALAGGDVAAAQSAFAAMVKGQVQHHERETPVTPPVTPPTTSSTGGTAGGLLSVTA